MKLRRSLVSLIAAFLLCLPTAAAHAANPGVNLIDHPTHGAIQDALATGAKTVRIFQTWSSIEPTTQGVLNAAYMADYDNAIRQLNAAGAKPLFVITEAPSWANGSSDPKVPPANPADFGDFLRRLAQHNRTIGDVAGYEVWNEPDEAQFWHPMPDAAKYTALLKAAYAGIKQGDPSAMVASGPMTGNNYDWLEQLYANGAGGSFDAIAVHTDTACLDRGPDEFYRDNGRLARYTFLGYRTVHDVMAAHGDGGKPIWMSELGWSSTGGGPTSCSRGQWAGQKPSGVDEAHQAEYLTKAYACLANDPYVTEAAWFGLRDLTIAPNDELKHYGLLRTDGSTKPAWSAFRAVAGAGGGAAGSCGDFDPPTLRIVKPTPGTQFVERLDVQAAATDGGVGLASITFNYDNGINIIHFNDLSNGLPVGLAPWFGSKGLPYGKHMIEVVAVDKNGNATRVTIPVEKVKTLKATLTPKIKLKTKKVKCVRRTCRMSGSLAKGVANAPTIGGLVAVEWQFLNNKKKWRRLSGGLAHANKPFMFKAKLRRPGRWRVRVVYRGQAPWKKTASKFLYFRLR